MLHHAMAQEKFLPEWAMWSFTVQVRLYYPVREGICAINHMQISTMFPSIMLVPIWKKITILLYFSDLGHREDYRHWHFSNRHGPACNDNIYILSISYIFWWKWLEVSWCLCWVHVARYWTVGDAEDSLWGEDRVILCGTQFQMSSTNPL